MVEELGTYGVWRSLRSIVPSMAIEIEKLGYGAIWIGGSPPGDLEAVEEILAATSEVPVITGIVNMWRHDVAELAGSYHRIEDRHPGRFWLGVGVGHRESVEQYRSPIEKITHYLDGLDAAGVPSQRIVLAALGPKALRVAADRTAGPHPYLTTPRHTARAREIIGAGPLLAPEQKATVDENRNRAREAGREIVSRYLRLVNYRNNLLREGWDQTAFEDGGSDELVDALALHGSAETVAEGIRAHVASGADHVCIQAIGADPIAEYQALAELLL